MDIKDGVGIIVSFFSACFAGYATYVARNALQTQHYVQQQIANYELLTSAESKFFLSPELMELHGIQLEELLKDGISPTELSYINLQLNAGAGYHRLNQKKQDDLSLFRKNFLKNEKVRIAWKKYLRGKMFNITPYSEAIDHYIWEIETACEEEMTPML